MKAFVLKVLLALLARLPLPAMHTLGAGLGYLLSVVPNRRRRTTRVNLALCFPELDVKSRTRLERTSLIEGGKALMESGFFWSRDPSEVLSRLTQVHGRQFLDDALARGRGVILAIPHLGAWEMINFYCSPLAPMTAMFSPPRIAQLGEPMLQGRERIGTKLVPTDTGGVRAMHRALKRGEIVCILPDQVPARDSGGVFAPFFGIQAKTIVLLSRLAVTSKAAVLFVYVERLPRARGFRLRFVPGHPDIGGDDLNRSVARLNEGVETCVRELPHQYQWYYKRFRDRPEGEPKLY